MLALRTLAIAGAVWALAGSVACAQESTSSPARSGLDAARNHFMLGMQFFDAHSYREALQEFREVARLTPSADVWFNIGRAHEELGEYESAAHAFERYLRDRVEAKDETAVRARVAKLEQLAREARERVQSAPDTGSLRIHSGARGALILVDGHPQGPESLHEPLLLSAGRHRLDVLATNRIPLHAEVDIEPGLLTAAYADLQPKREARTLPSSHGLGFGLFGVAGAGLITSAVFGSLSIARQSEGSAGQAEAWAQRADVTLAGAAVCALSAVIVYFIEGRSAQSELTTRAPAP
jgi:tetratricopeptide (TPR) repeat protein